MKHTFRNEAILLKLTWEEYMQFCRSINAVTRPENFFRIVSDSIKNIADKLDLAELTFEAKIAPKYTRLNGNDICVLFYRSETEAPDKDDPIILTTDSPGVGITTYHAFHTKDVPFTSADRENILFILQTIHNAASRITLSKNIITALSLDSLTGVYNVEAIHNNIVLLTRDDIINEYNGTFLNIIKFGGFNKLYGNRGGDMILKAVAQKLSEACEDREFVGRLGGDNFFIMYKKTRSEIWMDLFDGFDVSIRLNGEMKNVHISFYAGIYETTGSCRDIAQIIGNTSQTCKFARRPESPNLIFYSEAIEEFHAHSNEVFASYRDAIKNGDMILYFQPKVDLKTYELCGAEALSRWKYNDEIKSPAWYIPILEQSSAICDLDMYNLSLLCRTVRQWLDNGITPVRTSINLSRRNLADPHLADEILGQLALYNVPHEYIEIEITETTDVDEYASLLRFVHCLNENDITVSIDDFGTGFSSLNMLKDVSVDIIKFDRSLLTDSAYKDKVTAVISNLVRMAKDLGIMTVSEGIETVEQAEYLSSICCNTAQGYYFDKPLPPEGFMQKLKNRSYLDKKK